MNHTKCKLWANQLGDDELLLIVQLQQPPFWGKGRQHCNYRGRPTPPKSFLSNKEWQGISCYILWKGGAPCQTTCYEDNFSSTNSW